MSTVVTDPHARREAARSAATLVLVAAAWFWAVYAAIHLLDTQFDPLSAPGSAYVLGAYGGWMTTTFAALTAALYGTAVALGPRAPRTLMSRFARLAFVIAGTTALLAGVFPMDWPPPPRTAAGRIHALAGAVTLSSWVAGTILFSLTLRRDVEWTRRRRVLLALAVAAAVIFVTFPVLDTRLNLGGLAQRTIMAVLFAWMIVAVVHVRQRIGSSGFRSGGSC